MSELDLLKTGLRNTFPCIYPEDFYEKRQNSACTEMFQLSVRTTDAMKILLLSLSFYHPRGCRGTAVLITVRPGDSAAL